MRKFILLMIIASLPTAMILVSGCSNDVFTNEPDENRPPEIWLSSGPVEGDTTGYQVHFYWGGWDPDGEIGTFEFVVAEGSATLGFGFDPTDTTGLNKWTKTGVHDSLFFVPADENPRKWEVDSTFTKYDKTHTFFIRAVDLQGKRSEAAYLSFTAWTLAPTIMIDRPPGTGRLYSTIITFGWTGSDPIDSPQNVQTPDSIRYLITRINNEDGQPDPYFPIIYDLNQNPEKYEDLWSPWIWYRAEGDSGRVTTIGDDELLDIEQWHLFAVQAKDDAGAVTAIFHERSNARIFLVASNQAPILAVTEPYLGTYRFWGTLSNYMQNDIPPGIELNFRWDGTAAEYGGEIKGYRYGWDIQQIEDPGQWACESSPENITAAPITWYSGIHRLLVEVVDNGGKITYGKVEVTIIPFTMEKNLLWVDDYALEGTIPDMTDPSEVVHDAFWIGLCSKAEDFQPDRDVYDVRSNTYQPPKIRLIGQYANIAWTYNSSWRTAWGQIVRFIPESQVDTGTQIAINYLSLFLVKGGHLLSSGRTDRSGGGLIDAFFQSPLLPASFQDDMAPDPEDESGVNSMPYKDYCVTILDKVDGQFLSGDEMVPDVVRRVDWDGLRFMTKDKQDLTPGAIADYPEFADTLRLTTTVTCPTCFFNPSTRGFTYVEVFDPQYWLDFKTTTSQDCFHPMYRIKTRNALSAIDKQPIAVIITKYREKFEADIAAGKPVTILPANSFHFGFPLWFFTHTKVNAIVDRIFSDWEILKEEE